MLAIATAGCATTGALEALAYRYEDQPEMKRIEVRYRNNRRHGICLAPEHWRNKGGKIDQAGDDVRLHVAERTYPLEDFNTGYCPGGCATYVEPGQEIVGFISYRDFRLPTELEHQPKRLDFAPMGFACRRH